MEEMTDSGLLSKSLEEAQVEPETLAQGTIIENLDPIEAARLSKVRNIGIAVGLSIPSKNKASADLTGAYRFW